MHRWDVEIAHHQKFYNVENTAMSLRSLSSVFLLEFFFHLRLQSSSDRASFPATVFQFGQALPSCLSWRSLSRSAGVHARGTTGPVGEREREMLRAFAALSRWLPVEWRRRSGAGLGAARSGDFDSVEFGIGTSSAAGAVQCRTG